MRYLKVHEVLMIHSGVIEQSGGAKGVGSVSALESALAQPLMIFGTKELYPTIVEKASALGFLLIQNHPFVDGNKRTGHAAMEVFLFLNGLEIEATVDEQFSVIVRLAASQMDRKAFTDWVGRHITELEQSEYADSI